MIRQPVVSGQFYPSKPEQIKKLLDSFSLKKEPNRQKVIACILPHAGYVYSGRVAAEVLSKIEVARTCIILGPNHTGYGTPASILKDGEWITPFSSLKVDTRLAELLIKNSKYLQEDATAHAYEHSIEVELPLIQAIAQPEFSFVPIVLAQGDDLMYKDISGAIALAIRTLKKDVTIIASSDMTHYEQQECASKKDKAAIEAILKLDTSELLKKIDTLGISMCGYVPSVIAILAAKLLGATEAKLLAYQTSGDVTGDYSSVVGYAGITIQ